MNFFMSEGPIRTVKEPVTTSDGKTWTISQTVELRFAVGSVDIAIARDEIFNGKVIWYAFGKEDPD